MRIQVIIKTHAQEDSMIQLSEGFYKIYTKKLPLKGEANQRIIEIIAEYFSISKQQIRIVQGLKNKIKIVELTE